MNRTKREILLTARNRNFTLTPYSLYTCVLRTIELLGQKALAILQTKVQRNRFDVKMFFFLTKSKGRFLNVWASYLPGKGPSPGGIKSVARILPSLTGILFTPSAMYHFWNVALDKSFSEDLLGVTWSSKQFRTMLNGLVTSDFISRIPFLCPSAGFMLHNNPMGETPLYDPPKDGSRQTSTSPSLSAMKWACDSNVLPLSQTTVAPRVIFCSGLSRETLILVILSIREDFGVKLSIFRLGTESCKISNSVFNAEFQTQK